MAGEALVIGGAGFLGTGIARELRRAGWSVTSAGRGRKSNTVPDVAFVRVDRSEPGALAQAFGDRRFDLVVDCAAYQRPDAEDAVATFAGKTSHYVFISTDFVYSPAIDGPFPIDEDAPKETSAPYGTGKLACEAVLTEAWHARRFPFTALRPPHIIGAGKELGTGSVEGRDPDLLRHIRTGTGVTLLAEGFLVIQPVLNREVGACIAHLAGNEGAFGGIFNCAGPERHTTRRYYQMVADRLGVPLKTETMTVAEYLQRWPEKAPFARHRPLDLTRLLQATGYRPQFSLRDALHETIDWLEQRGGTSGA